ELVGVLAVIGLGTWQMADGLLTLGGLLAFMAYVSKLFGPVRSLSRLANTIAAASAGADRICELLDAESSVRQRADAEPLGRARGRVDFDRVTFTYAGARSAAVTAVSTTVGPGEVLALRGPSGSGKSTLTSLLLRLYDVDSGAIRLDGYDVRDV